MSPKTYTQICNNTNRLINIASSKNTDINWCCLSSSSRPSHIYIYIYIWSFRKSLRHICRKSSGTVISCLHQTHNIISYCLLNRSANIPITALKKNPYIYIYNRRPTAIGHVLICVRLWCDYHQSESMCIVQLNSEIIQPPTHHHTPHPPNFESLRNLLSQVLSRSRLLGVFYRIRVSMCACSCLMQLFGTYVSVLECLCVCKTHAVVITYIELEAQRRETGGCGRSNTSDRNRCVSYRVRPYNKSVVCMGDTITRG